MKQSGLGYTGKTILIVIITLLVADTLLGYVLLRQNRQNMKELIDGRVLDIAKTAAAMLDGDVLGALQKADEGTPEYQRVYDTLAFFQNNFSLSYIYGIRDDGDGTFSFTIDPDPVDPDDFGGTVVTTAALIKASQGTPSVDQVPFTDDWGRFYSAYSPVYDSAGNIAGIVGVDFDADWYDAQVRESTTSILLISVLSVLLGAMLVVVLSSGYRRRFRALGGELTALAQDMETLTDEMARGGEIYDGDGDGDGYDDEPGAPAAPAADDGAQDDYLTDDEFSALSEKIRTLQGKLRDYLAFTRQQAYTDALSGVGSRMAYLDMLEKTQKHLDDGTADFCLTVFDIDDLKGVNDNLGHEAGDRLIMLCAAAICDAFGRDHVYRIGGDEFITVRVGKGEEDLRAWSAALAAELAKRQAKHPELPIALSWGSAVYDPAADPDYRSVFARADKEMYAVKEAHHRAGGYTGRG